MRLLSLVVLLSSPLLAQLEIGKQYVVWGSDQIPQSNEDKLLPSGAYTTYFIYQADRTGPNTKNFHFIISKCPNPIFAYDASGKLVLMNGLSSKCIDLTQSQAEQEYGSVVDAKLSQFKNQYPKATWTKSYGPFTRPYGPDLETAPVPTTQPDPYFIYLDGTGDSILKVDLTTFAVVSQVVVPSTTGPFAIQPTPTGPGNEAWVANGGTEISVVDLGTQSLLSTILTPSIPQGTEPVAGIVFTNSGATALEAVGFYTPDSSGNNGALLVIDAASQQVTSTLPLKTAPTALVMAPDGLTAYILDGGGTLTYYDVLSGTADLSVSTYLPGMSGGYPGAGSQVFIHPDGTRLFWNENYILSVFDLTTRQITNFNSGLPSTSPVSFQLSQDGSIAFMGNGAGNVVFLDTRYGTVINTYQGVAWGTAVFGFNPVN